jgi:DNA adenine methylase
MTPEEILDTALQRVLEQLNSPLIQNADIGQRIELICRNLQNRAGVRLVLACALAKCHQPHIDVRKPYTEIGDKDAFSGRTYDERYLSRFINKHILPCNPTTAFLTPALRNIDRTLTPDLVLVGRPREVYRAALELLNDVHETRTSAFDVLCETIRFLLIVKNETVNRMESLLAGLKMSKGDAALSAEMIVVLIQQHLAFKGSSRLPVLVVAAAYQAVSSQLGERVIPLEAHNAADKQTQALGDIQIALSNDDHIVTVYEMKMKRVTLIDIESAMAKMRAFNQRIDNYIFITTDIITEEVSQYALSLYEQTGGVEVVVLDCIGFLRHFLHLFHRQRQQFLDTYQELVLAEPNSAVSQPLKEAFLALRQAAESTE